MADNPTLQRLHRQACEQPSYLRAVTEVRALMAAVPALLEIESAARILRQHIDVHREDMPGSIHAGARRLDEAFERLAQT
jgi:hypothetical protein